MSTRSDTRTPLSSVPSYVWEFDEFGRASAEHPSMPLRAAPSSPTLGHSNPPTIRSSKSSYRTASEGFFPERRDSLRYGRPSGSLLTLASHVGVRAPEHVHEPVHGTPLQRPESYKIPLSKTATSGSQSHSDRNFSHPGRTKRASFRPDPNHGTTRLDSVGPTQMTAVDWPFTSLPEPNTVSRPIIIRVASDRPILRRNSLPARLSPTRGTRSTREHASRGSHDMQPPRAMQVLKRSDNKRSKCREMDRYADFDPHACVAEWLRERDDNKRRAKRLARSTQPIRHANNSQLSRPAMRIPRKPVPTRAPVNIERETDRLQDLQIRSQAGEQLSHTGRFIVQQNGIMSEPWLGNGQPPRRPGQDEYPQVRLWPDPIPRESRRSRVGRALGLSKLRDMVAEIE